MKILMVCPGHLAAGFDRYCPSCTRKLFDGKRVSPMLDFDYDADSADMAKASISFPCRVYRKNCRLL